MYMRISFYILKSIRSSCMNEHVWIQLTLLLTAFFSVLAAMWQSLTEMDTELFPHLKSVL